MEILISKYPSLVAKNFRLLVPSIKMRPDISTHDCMVQSVRMDEKIGPDFFKIRDQAALDQWLYVCEVKWRIFRSHVCLLQPRNRNGEPVRDVNARARRTQYLDENADGLQDWVWEHRLEKEKLSRKKKAKTKRRLAKDPDGDTLMERFANKKRKRKQSQRMMDSVEQEKSLDLKEPRRKKRRKQ